MFQDANGRDEKVSLGAGGSVHASLLVAAPTVDAIHAGF
jgi:hypothetical protein